MPNWFVANRRALNGNVLITGSIGSGKSQGAILPYFEQLVSNFDPFPAILCIDPKRTFIEEARRIIARHGLSDRVMDLKLGGTATFNPIYDPNALRNSKFVDIAQMVRAASVNATGKSFDSPFWEVSAFNLVKNCIVYCSAIKSYYTLKDLYSTLVQAASTEDTFSEGLDECLSSDRFDEEQKFNIGCAKEYFVQEYKELDDKVRTGILATSTSFLNQFQEYRAARAFCPTQDALTLTSMDALVDEGRILLFDVSSPALARSMGTFVKLHFEQSVLDRLANPSRSKERSAALIIDEYQDVVTSGYGSALGDDRFLAKSREANGIMIGATQSITSLENSIGKDKPTFELIQNFRTKIFAHSTDLGTIRLFQELMGQRETERTSRSFSEHANQATRNLFLGDFETDRPSISESVSTSTQREYEVTAREFARLNTFETFAQLYDGVSTRFERLYWKPYYLPKKTTPHSKILASLRAAAACLMLGLFPANPSHAFPNVCSVVKTKEFRSCLDFQVSGCMCGFPPRPCAQISYFVPQSFIEVMPEPKSSYFSDMPGAAGQLAALGKKPVPFGVESDDATHAFHAHVTSVPFTEMTFSALPCGGARMTTTCFEAMSEHTGDHWTTGNGDLLQPQFLAWSLSPAGCLIKGAAQSAAGEPGSFSPAAPICSSALGGMPKYPPSAHSACTGWGIFFPRNGIYNGPSQAASALMVGARMKSLASEVFQATPADPSEIWQMISPDSSSCFREGQNVGLLETVKNVREVKRLMSGRPTGFLFVTWKRVSCCRDLPTVPAAMAALAVMQGACQAVPSP